MVEPTIELDVNGRKLTTTQSAIDAGWGKGDKDVEAAIEAHQAGLPAPEAAVEVEDMEVLDEAEDATEAEDEAEDTEEDEG